MISVIGLKLMTGEEIIAKVGTPTSDEWANESGHTLIDPRIIMIQPAQGGQMHLVLIPYITATKKTTCFIPSSRIVTMFKPDAEIETGYLEQVSGLVLAQTLNG